MEPIGVEALRTYIEHMSEGDSEEYGGMPKEHVMTAVLNHLSSLTTDMVSRSIWFGDIQNLPDGESKIEYRLSNEECDNYNHLKLRNFELVSVRGNGSNEVKKIYDIINLMSLHDFYEIDGIYFKVREYTRIIRELSDVKIGVSDEDKARFMDLIKLHRNLLLNQTAKDCIQILRRLRRMWEFENFYVIPSIESGGRTSKLVGQFKNTAPIQQFDCKRTEIIIFPYTGRQSMCLHYGAIKNIGDLVGLPEGYTVKLQKGSTIREYTYIECIDEDLVALRDKKGKVKFFTSLWNLECAFDALFECNRIIGTDQWKRNKYTYVV